MNTDVAANEIPTTGSKHLPADPRSLEALGRHHTLLAALAELVDNSIDAHASHVLIRFVRDGDRLVRLLVVDDGCGMDDNQIDIAMTVGGDRSYEGVEIGRFGLGLKAASFSQARSVTVVSRASGHQAVGRRWRTEQAKKDLRCDIVDARFAAEQLDGEWGMPTTSSGTVVRWDEVKGFPIVATTNEIERFLQASFASIRSHLGLIFHRLLDRESVRILIDVQDIDQGELLRTQVGSLDPFGYSRTGAAGWPKDLHAGRGGLTISLRCAIWPGRSGLDQFKLDGDLLGRQGIYVYFNDRLVQRGGWNGLIHPDKQLNLARAAINVSGDIEGILTLNPEKNGVEVGPEFALVIRQARARDGTTFEDYIERARGVFKDANRRKRERVPMLPAGSGFDPKVRRALAREFPQKHEDPVEVRWTNLPYDEFFAIDREDGVLWLNKRYRRELLGGRRGGLNDLPVVKALLFLLLENIFAGQNMGPRDKDNLEAWQAILAAAVRAEAS